MYGCSPEGLKKKPMFVKMVYLEYKGGFMRRTLIFLLAGALLFSFTAMAQTETETDQDLEGVVAIVNGEEISEDSLNAAGGISQILQTLYTGHPLFAQLLFTSSEGEAFLDLYQREILDQLIDSRLLVQKAKQEDIEVDAATLDAKVEEQINQIMEQNQLTLDQMEEILGQQGSSLDEFKDRIRGNFRENLLVQGLRDKIVAEASVSEEEINTYYEENQDQYTDEDGNLQPLTEVKDEISDRLLGQAQNKLWGEWFETVRGDADIEIRL
jgi:parvulin-like peptidyl-prolyl isomerase